jgi:hypothetical protein
MFHVPSVECTGRYRVVFLIFIFDESHQGRQSVTRIGGSRMFHNDLLRTKKIKSSSETPTVPYRNR